MNDLVVYLDNSATTRVDPRVAEKMIPYLTEMYGNPASRTHSFGWTAEEAVEEARANVAALVNCDPKEIVWTSGATESINLALKGAAKAARPRGKHLITMSIEHKATLDTMKQLEKEDFEVTYLNPESNGLLDLEKLKAAIRPDTTIISIMYVNNEIGVIQDIEAISKICAEKKIVFHVDAAQATGKVEIDLKKLNVDLMSFSAHKTHGPKGVGALYVSRTKRPRIEAQIHGGGHERGLRSGTMPTHQLVGMGEAFKIAKENLQEERAKAHFLTTKLHDGLANLEEVYVNGDMEHRVPHNLNISFKYVEGESLMMAIKQVAVSSGSACTSASLEPSYVLKAIGRSDELAHSSIRFTVGRFTTVEDIDFTIDLIRSQIGRLRDLSPLWEMFKDGVDVDNYPWTPHEAEDHEAHRTF